MGECSLRCYEGRFVRLAGALGCVCFVGLRSLWWTLTCSSIHDLYIWPASVFALVVLVFNQCWLLFLWGVGPFVCCLLSLFAVIYDQD